MLTLRALAQDPPHVGTNSVGCGDCHLPHHSVAAVRTNSLGDANLCLSCHQPGGTASLRALMDADQALPGPGLPTNVAASGTSHRWDSGLSGHLEFLGGATNRSSGMITSGGDFTGRLAKTYSLVITQAGDVGSARFNWAGSQPGGGAGAGTNLICTTSNVLDQGIYLAFANGPTGPSFRVGDRWNLYVRPDVSWPTNVQLLAGLYNGFMACSTCHNQHSQTNAPFDPTAPAYGGPGTGYGRHFQQSDNSACQMCTDCHAARNVTNAAAGSHPVGMAVVTNAYFKAPTNLPLEKSAAKVRCLTCHDIHNSGSTDGDLLRIANRTALCTECHTLADTATPAAHLNPTNGVLWPGGAYGSTYPQKTDPALRGTCVNCHNPHGWQDNANPALDFPSLLVEREENLCFTCHDTNGPAAKTVMDDFGKTVHHPVVDSDWRRRGLRAVECTDCHNTHRAQSGTYDYNVTATSNRNLVGNANIGVTGVVASFTGLANFVAPAYTSYAVTNDAKYEYQICFKCHTAYWWTTNAPPNGLSANGSVTNPVETDVALGFSPKNRSGHPVVTGLSNYTNSFLTTNSGVIARGLPAAVMKAPWNVNLGQQTMQCTDCHNTDDPTPAAQGPHGSASKFMLRGANATNWPNVTIANYTQSWCANCHINTGNAAHNQSAHSGFQCYICHIVVPHGGKLSRLIADNDAMPSRYAYNNTTNINYVQGFSKRPAANYSSSNCKAQCDGAHSGRSPTENW